METKFNFNSAICTNRVQSERLLALGLKKETADMHLVSGLGIEQCFSTPYAEATIRTQTDICFPAWSLHRLIEMIAGGKWKDYIVFVPYAYDAIIDDIETEIEKGFFNEDYLGNGNEI